MAEINVSGNISNSETKISLPTSESNISTSSSSWFSTQNLLAVGNKAAGTAAGEWIQRRRQGLKSWRDFFNTNKFKTPTGVTTVGRRLLINVEQFQSNYLCVFIVLFVYCILTSPLLLIALAACLGAIYFIRVKNTESNRVVIAGREISPAYQYAAVAVLSFPLFYVAGAGATIFWVIGASIFVIVLHALFYASEPIPGAEFEMEEV
jgi:hypothetical protein